MYRFYVERRMHASKRLTEARTCFIITFLFKNSSYNITFFTRSDRYAYGKSFLKGDRSYNLSLQTELLSNPKRQFFLNTTFRKLQIINPLVSKQEADETILGRAEYVMNEVKGLLTGNILYEVGAGQEQRRDLTYIEVPAGTGQYAWINSFQT